MFALTLALTLSATAQQAEQLLPSDRPVGQNCALTQPPPSSGEWGEYRAFFQVYPRRSAIGRRYTGCQAVFASESTDSTMKLFWLVHVVAGEPVRIWSDIPNSQLNCHYQNRKLVNGSTGSCPENEKFLLFGSAPAGCSSNTRIVKNCNSD